MIIQVAKAAGDAFLEARRIGAAHQQIKIVIAFEDERIASRQARFNVCRDRAGIGENAEARVAVREYILHRFIRIVRHQIGRDFDIADRKARMRIDIVEPCGINCTVVEKFRGAVREPNRNLVFTRETCNAADVIRMLVGHQNGINIGRSKTGARETRFRLCEAKSTIEHHRGLIDLHDQRVAFAATAEGGKSQGLCEAPL